MIKKKLIEILDFYRYKIENDKCTDEDMKSAFDLLSKNVVVDATIDDISSFYAQSGSNVRNVICRKYIGRPKRRVFYNFVKFCKIAPKSWKN